MFHHLPGTTPAPKNLIEEGPTKMKKSYQSNRIKPHVNTNVSMPRTLVRNIQAISKNPNAILSSAAWSILLLRAMYLVATLKYCSDGKWETTSTPLRRPLSPLQSVCVGPPRLHPSLVRPPRERSGDDCPAAFAHNCTGSGRIPWCPPP